MWLIFLLVALVSSKIKIIEPQGLKEQFKEQNYTIQAVYGNYGHIPYGQSLQGQVFFNSTNPLGCVRNNGFYENPTKNKDNFEPHVYLVERGECTFVTKSRNIAREGGQVALVIDNKNENITKIIMSDDGAGAGLRIPSMLIGNYEGQILKKYMLNHPTDNIVLSFEFIHPLKKDNVTLQIWYPPANDKSLRLIRDLGRYIKPMIKNIIFEPNIITIPCQWCPSKFKEMNCLGDGKYCQVSPFSMKEGTQMIHESLNQHCLAEILKKQNKLVDFFTYISFVYELCGHTISKKCHELGLQKIKQPVYMVNKCVNETFEDNDTSKSNPILDDMNQKWSESGTRLYPQVLVNGQVFRGQLNPVNIYEDICSSFSKTPKGCKKWVKKQGGIYKKNNYLGKGKGFSNKGLMLIVGVLIVINVGLFTCYRRKLNSDLQADLKIQVNAAVQEYIAVSSGRTQTETEDKDEAMNQNY